MTDRGLQSLVIALILACAADPVPAAAPALVPSAEPEPPPAPALSPTPDPSPAVAPAPALAPPLPKAARDSLYDAVTTRLIPAWRGTPWTFYGHAEVPGEEPVASGYWVASVLRDVGFRVDRDPLGRQASERILLTFAAKKTLRHFGSSPPETVVDWATKQGRGLWGVGLANHAGLLWNDGEEVRFCHSNSNGGRGPMCENALFSGPFQTSYTVVASMLADATVDAWIAGRTLPIASFDGAGG